MTRPTTSPPDGSLGPSTHGFDLPPRPAFPIPAAADYSNTALRASRGPWSGVVEHRNVALDGALPMDIFVPQQCAAPADVLVFFHGGGWVHGWKEWASFMAPHLAERGMILVAPSYRIAPEHRYPACLEDALDAVAAIHGQIAQYGGAPDRIIVAGHSAGGHLAAMVTLRADRRAAHKAHGVIACMTLSAILDLTHANPPPGSLEAMVYEKVLAQASDDRDASPLTWLEDLDMPWSMSWGTRDTERVRLSNETADQRLNGRPGFVAQTYDADHFGTHLSLIDGGHDWYRQLDAIREQTL